MNSVTFEATPNPSTLKFNLPFEVTPEGFECASAQETERSPLASKIFGFPWAEKVFIGPRYITVTKQNWVEWSFLAKPLADLITEHLRKGEPVAVNSVVILDENSHDTPMEKQIKALLNQEIRPMVALDGGDVVFVKYEDGVLSLKMKGACAGCPSSQVTLKQGIEVRFQQKFPEIQKVIAV